MAEQQDIYSKINEIYENRSSKLEGRRAIPAVIASTTGLAPLSGFAQAIAGLIEISRTEKQKRALENAVGKLKENGWSDEEIWNYLDTNGYTSEKLTNKDIKTIDEEVKTAISTKKSDIAASNRLQNVYDMLDKSYDTYTKDMILNPYGEAAQQYKRDQYAAINEYEASLDRSLAASEMSAYQQIGQQQLELESTIAKQRLQALKSGTTSAQLASQQLANMFAAQSGAAQIANNVMQSRLQNTNAIAQSRLGVTSDLYSMINSNQQAAANVGAQIAAAKANFASTYLQSEGQYTAYANALQNKNVYNTLSNQK